MIERAMKLDPITGVQIRIGVMGSASEPVGPAVAVLCRRLGRTIAERGACLLTGACPGLPHESVLGAKEAGGHVVGISPAATLREHIPLYTAEQGLAAAERVEGVPYQYRDRSDPDHLCIGMGGETVDRLHVRSH